MQPLTPQQRAVLKLLAEGKTDAEIGLDLGLKPKAVADHVRKARERVPDGWDVGTRVGLANYYRDVVAKEDLDNQTAGDDDVNGSNRESETDSSNRANEDVAQSSSNGQPLNESTNPEPTRQSLRQYLEWVIKSAERIPRVQIGAAAGSSLFVARQVRLSPSLAPRSRINTSEDPSYWDEELERVGLGQSAAWANDEPDEGAPTWEQVRRQLRRGIILGDAGMGKTMLLHRESARIAQQSLEQLDSGTDVEDIELPVLVRLDDVAIELAHGSDLTGSLIAVTRTAIGRALDAPDAEARAFWTWVASHLGSRRSALLLDGLDELPAGMTGDTVSPRDRVEQALGELVHTDHERQISLLIGSRIHGYRPPWPIEGSVEECELELMPLRPADIQLFIDQWFAAQPATRDTLGRRLAADPRLRTMAQNPLLLAFLCALAAAPGGIDAHSFPQGRAQLYEGILQEIVRGQWRTRERDRTDAVGVVEAKVRLLEPIALDLATDESGWLGTFPLDRLGDAVRNTPSEESLEATISRPTLIDELTAHDGLLVQVARPSWGYAPAYTFLHRSFQEYLVARALSRMPRDEMLEVVGKHLWFEPEWEQVLLFLAARLADPSPLIRRLLSERHDAFHQMALLSARCLAECPPQLVPGDLVGTVVKRCSAALRSRSFFGRQRAVLVLSILPTENVIRIALRQIALRGPVAEGWSDIPEHLAFQGAVVPLLDAPRSDNLWVRAAAAESLGAIGHPAGFEALLALLWDGSPPVAKAAARSLGLLGDQAAVPELLRLVSDDKWRTRYVDAVRKLEENTSFVEDEADAAAVNIASLSEWAWEVASNAAWAVGRLGGPKAEQGALDLLRDSRDDVRELAVIALAELISDAATDALVRATTDPSTRVRIRAVQELANSRGEYLKPTLEPLLHDRTSEVGLRATIALAARGEISERGLLGVLERFEEPSTKVRDLLAATLPRACSAETLKVLAASNKTWVRTLAVECLGTHGGPLATEVLTQVLLAHDDEYWVTRHAAAAGLGTTTGREAIRALLSAADDDPDVNVRVTAVTSLGKMRAVQAVSLFSQILHDAGRDIELRKAAAVALSRIQGETVSEMLEVDAPSRAALAVEIAAGRLARGDVTVINDLVRFTRQLDGGVAERAYGALLQHAAEIRGQPGWPGNREQLWRATRNLQRSGLRAVKLLTRLAARGLVSTVSDAAEDLGRALRPHRNVSTPTSTSSTEEDYEMRNIVRHYTIGRSGGDWMGIMNTIEHHRQSAVVRRLQERDWEAWFEGRLLGSFPTEAAAFAAVQAAGQPPTAAS